MAVSKKNWFLVLAALSLGVVITSTANAAGLLIADGGLGGVLEIKEQNVHVMINNGIAVTEVDQVFVNTEKRVVEALYTFPVPKGASVSNFSMWIGGKEMIGEVVEKERARQIYDSYKQQKRDPGLLEQVDYKRFEMRIFPIPAGAEQRVKLTYYQELDTDHDWATYVYPLATLSRPGIDERTKGHFAVTLDIKNEVPIVALESPSHKDRVVVAKNGDNYWRASLETPAGSLNQDVVVAFHCERPTTGMSVITSKAEGQPGVLQLSLTAGKELEESIKGMDYVFVLDVSGSMAFDSKLPLSRQSMRSFIEALGPEDNFEVITFNIAPNTLFNQTRPANPENLKQATAFLDSQKAVGGTVLRPALETAYRYQNPDRTLNVVILSDGMTEQAEQTQLVQLIQKRPAGSRVFCVGVGNEVNRPLLAQLADQAGGLAAFISQGDDFGRQAQAFRRKLMRPAISNVKVAFEGGNVYDVQPKELPNLYHGMPLRIYGRYQQAGATNVTITGDVQGQPFQQSIKIDLPARNDSNPEIERMWAWKQVDQLLATARERGSVDSVREEVVKLCEEFSITSEYASFIVLENDAEYQRWKIERKNVQRLGRDRAAQESVRQQLETLRQQALSKLGPSSNAARDSVASSLPTSPQSAEKPTIVQSIPSNLPNQGPVTVDRPHPSFDLRLPGASGGGGGAIDPISAAIGLGLAAASAVAAKKRLRVNTSNQD